MRAWRLVLAVPACVAAGLGAPPSTATGARDLGAAFALPALRDARGSDVLRDFEALQVGRRVRRLGIDGDSATRAWHAADASLGRARARIDAPRPVATHAFVGGSASALNALLRAPEVTAVRVAGAVIEVDEPISLDRDGQSLDLGGATLSVGRRAPRFLVRVEHASHVTIRGGVFDRGAWAVLVHRSRDVLVEGGRYRALTRGGVVLSDASEAIVTSSRFTAIDGAAVLIHGDTRDAVVLGNEIVGNLGHSN